MCIGALASASVLPMNTHWFELLTVQGTLRSLLQHHSLKASILWRSAFFMVQLTSTHDYWKSKVMSLVFNMLSSFVIALLPRSKLDKIAPW